MTRRRSCGPREQKASISVDGPMEQQERVTARAKARRSSAAAASDFDGSPNRAVSAGQRAAARQIHHTRLDEEADSRRDAQRVRRVSKP